MVRSRGTILTPSWLVASAPEFDLFFIITFITSRHSSVAERLPSTPLLSQLTGGHEFNPHWWLTFCINLGDTR